MDNTINNDIIQKVVIRKTAIYKAIAMLPPIETKDLWEEKNLIEHQKNYENKNVSETNDTMNETKTNSTPNDWRDITDPKLREKIRKKEKDKRYREKHKDKIKLKKKIYREANKEKSKEYSKDWREVNKDRLKTKKKKYAERNRDKIKEYKRKYRIVNIEKIKAYRELHKNDVQQKLSNRLRQRLSQAIKGSYKAGSAVKDLGCTISELKTYLESKFQTGMTWDNYGLYGWHIDHIKPLASFDLSDRKQMLEACHYTNLQPLWAQDNLAKSDKIL